MTLHRNAGIRQMGHPVAARTAREPLGWSGRIIQLFPASTFVLAPYLGLIVPIAILQGNAQLPSILGLLGLALLGTLTAETLMLPFRNRARTGGVTSGPGIGALRNITLVVFLVSCLARITYIGAGGGSLLSQLGGVQNSGISSVAGLFASWNLAAVGLLLASYKRCTCKLRTLWGGVAILVLIELWAVLQTTITAPLIQFVSATCLLTLILGLVRLRTLAIGLLIVLVAWPVLYAARNSLRSEMGAAVDQSVSAFDRLRFDEQLTAVTQFSVPVSAGQPDAVQIARYGLVPRVLDPGRPDLSSARLINRILGGSATSSFNFLSIGTLYFFYGPGGLVLFYFAAALLFCFLLTRAVQAGPIEMSMAMLAASYLFGWASTFPDTVIGYFQSLIAFVPILVLLLAFTPRRKSTPRPLGSTSGS